MSQHRGPLSPEQQRPVDQEANPQEHTGAGQDAQEVARDLPSYTPQGRTDSENEADDSTAQEAPGFTPMGQTDNQQP